MDYKDLMEVIKRRTFLRNEIMIYSDDLIDVEI